MNLLLALTLNAGLKHDPPGAGPRYSYFRLWDYNPNAEVSTPDVLLLQPDRMSELEPSGLWTPGEIVSIGLCFLDTWESPGFRLLLPPLCSQLPTPWRKWQGVPKPEIQDIRTKPSLTSLQPEPQKPLLDLTSVRAFLGHAQTCWATQEMQRGPKKPKDHSFSALRPGPRPE